MAEDNMAVFKNQFRCPVCLDLLKDPVTVPCGHSFCMICITHCWNQDHQKRVYSCPQCRQTFTPRPALGNNVILAEMVEKLKNTNFQSDGSGPSYAGPEDVECDVCTGRKRKASKSCLVCLESYCQTHFECHDELHSRKRHKVTEATGRLQEMICSQHGRLLEVFCRTDQTFICLWCRMDEHKNHDTVSAAVEKQRLVENNQRNVQERIREKEKKRHELREAVKTHKISAQSAVEDTEKIFIELIRSIEERHYGVIQLIRDQEKTAVSRAEGVLKELEQEIDDLRRTQDEIQQFHTDDHISFHQTAQREDYGSFNELDLAIDLIRNEMDQPSHIDNHILQDFDTFYESPGSTDIITVSPLHYIDDVRKSVNYLKEKVEDLFTREIEKVSSEDFRPFSLELSTVNKNISLSEEDRTATGTRTVQPYPDHPDRFDSYRQVW